MNLTEAGKILLQRTRDQMLRTGPEHFDMGQWYDGPGAYSQELVAGFRIAQDRDFLNKCGTTACFAGHLVLAADDSMRITLRHEFDKGAQIREALLTMTGLEEWMFFVGDWPNRLIDFSEKLQSEEGFSRQEAHWSTVLFMIGHFLQGWDFEWFRRVGSSGLFTTGFSNDKLSDDVRVILWHEDWVPPEDGTKWVKEAWAFYADDYDMRPILEVKPTVVEMS